MGTTSRPPQLSSQLRNKITLHDGIKPPDGTMNLIFDLLARNSVLKVDVSRSKITKAAAGSMRFDIISIQADARITIIFKCDKRTHKVIVLTRDTLFGDVVLANLRDHPNLDTDRTDGSMAALIPRCHTCGFILPSSVIEAPSSQSDTLLLGNPLRCEDCTEEEAAVLRMIEDSQAVEQRRVSQAPALSIMRTQHAPMALPRSRRVRSWLARMRNGL